MRTDLFRKYVSSSMIICYRSVVRHPFLLGMIIVLFSMYRLFPFLFSILVSASPVIVSTAVLLGTLLSFGQPNIPEIETESKSKSDLDEIRKSESKVDRDVNFASESKIEVSNRSFDDNCCVEGDDDIDRPVNLVEFGEEQLVDEAKSEMEEEKVVLGSHYSPLQQTEDEHIVLENDEKLWEGSPDPLNSNSGLLWKRVEREDDDDDNGDDDDDEGSDSGSDIAESSSPDASMADIIPMLDELHPLLSEEQETHEVPPHHMSRDGIDAVSEHSLESSDTSTESNDDEDDKGDVENREDLEVGNDDEDDDKESKHTDKEDETETRSAILWTEYDQKNLMNLGTSEMERNRRLENLIARRRARKTMRMQAEKNLIDLESADLPWNIPPISTARINPFDYDSNDNIPGSAPSVLLQRRNPFDLPYDSSEEKPDLVGDTFQQEFAVVQPKEPFFRRHESFNVGPSMFGASRSERHETRMKPYFVPERSFAEFQRQFSGLSDSRVSSVPDTESVSSDSDLENKDHIEDNDSVQAEQGSVIRDHTELVSENEQPLIEIEHESDHQRPYFVPEHVASDVTNFSSFQRQLSEVSDSKVSSVPDTESDSSDGDLENEDRIDISQEQEQELMSIEDYVHNSEVKEDESEHVSQENESFQDNENVESVHIDENAVGIQLNLGDEELHRSGPNLSSSDEASDPIYNDKEEDDDEVATSVSETTYFVDRVNSIERSDIGVSSLLVEESQPNEPIYDLSPRSVTRNLSSSSISNDLHKDESFQSSSSVTDSSSEINKAQNQLPNVPDNEEPLLVGENIATSLSNDPVLETEDVLLDIDATHQLENVQIPSLNSDEISHEGVHQEEVVSQLEEALLDRSMDKPLMEDPEELQDHELEQGQVPSSNSEVVQRETYETPHQFVSEAEALSQPSEENSQVLQEQITSNNSDNLPIEAPENNVLLSINSVSSVEPDMIEVADIETKAPGSPTYESDTHSIESNEIKEIDENLLVELDAVGDFSVKDLGSTSNEMEQDPHVSDHDLETNRSVDEDSDPEDLEPTLNEVKQDQDTSDHDLETKLSSDKDSYSNDLESNLNEIKQDQDTSNLDLLTKLSSDEDSNSKVLVTTLDEIKQDQDTADLDLETKVSGDEDSYSNDLGSNLNEIKQDQNALNHDLETNRSVDEDSYSNDLGTTLDETKQDPHALEDNRETNRSVDEDSYSKDLESTFNEMRQDQRAPEHRLETFFSVDENFYSKHVESTLNEMKQDQQAIEHDLKTNRSGDEKDDEITKSQNEKEISDNEVASEAEAEASLTKLIGDDKAEGNDVLPQETESITSLVNSSDATMLNNGTEDASSTSNTDKE